MKTIAFQSLNGLSVLRRTKSSRDNETINQFLFQSLNGLSVLRLEGRPGALPRGVRVSIP